MRRLLLSFLFFSAALAAAAQPAVVQSAQPSAAQSDPTATAAQVAPSLPALPVITSDGQPSPDKVQAHLYGSVRGDMSYLSRLNASSLEGSFVLYPLDWQPDAAGHDLNDVGSLGFYSINSKLGVDLAGGRALGAGLSGRIEADFGGFSTSFGANATVLRVRHAYLRMNWRHADLIVGQTFHPFVASFVPDVLAMSIGAPFTSTVRAPQVRLVRRAGRFTFSGAALWQLQVVSRGPAGNSDIYQQQAGVPELYLGANYSAGGLTFGADADRLVIRPRTRSVVGTDVFRVDESLSSLSCGAYMRYTKGLLSIGGKSIWGQNLPHVNMLGGYGVSAVDPVTGRQTYTNFNFWTSMVSATYGKIYRVGLFAAWSRNMGTQKALVAGSPLYGMGLTFNRLARLTVNFSYNLPWFTLGAEYELTAAAYGDPDTLDYASGRYAAARNVTGHRLAALILYRF